MTGFSASKQSYESSPSQMLLSVGKSNYFLCPFSLWLAKNPFPRSNHQQFIFTRRQWRSYNFHLQLASNKQLFKLPWVRLQMGFNFSLKFCPLSPTIYNWKQSLKWPICCTLPTWWWVEVLLFLALFAFVYNVNVIKSGSYLVSQLFLLVYWRHCVTVFECDCLIEFPTQTKTILT